MDKKARKELLQQYANRRPEMGVISFYCKETKEEFLAVSKDMPADFNSIRFKLDTGTHPNKKLLALWNQYGENGFELTVASVLKYEDPKADHMKDLEALRDKCFEKNPEAGKIWL